MLRLVLLEGANVCLAAVWLGSLLLLLLMIILLVEAAYFIDLGGDSDAGFCSLICCWCLLKDKFILLRCCTCQRVASASHVFHTLIA